VTKLMIPLFLALGLAVAPPQDRLPVRFGAVSIKIQPPGYRPPREEAIGPVRPCGRYSNQHAILWTLITFAHPQYQFPGKTVVGLPDWAFGRPGSVMDFEAVPEAGTSPDLTQMQQMMDSALADRFGLKFHMEKRRMPVLFLELSPGGPRLVNPSPPGQQSLLLRIGPSAIFGRGASMDELAGLIGTHFETKPVLNRTGLEGFYDIDLAPPPRSPSGGPIARMDAGDNRSAIEREVDRLGMKLVAGKADVPVMVVDHVAMPTPN